MANGGVVVVVNPCTPRTDGMYDLYDVLPLQLMM